MIGYGKTENEINKIIDIQMHNLIKNIFEKKIQRDIRIKNDFKDYGEDIVLTIGKEVYHEKYKLGKIIEICKFEGKNAVVVKFKSGVEKKIAVEYLKYHK